MLFQLLNITSAKRSESSDFCSLQVNRKYCNCQKKTTCLQCSLEIFAQAAIAFLQAAPQTEDIPITQVYILEFHSNFYVAITQECSVRLTCVNFRMKALNVFFHPKLTASVFALYRQHNSAACSSWQPWRLSYKMWAQSTEKIGYHYKNDRSSCREVLLG